MNIFEILDFVQSISPGGVETEMVSDDFVKLLETLGSPLLRPENISGTVLYVLGTPPNVQVIKKIY